MVLDKGGIIQDRGRGSMVLAPQAHPQSLAVSEFRSQEMDQSLA